MGREAIEKIFGKNREKPYQEIVDNLVEEMNEFNQGIPLEDDVTMVAVRMV